MAKDKKKNKNTKEKALKEKQSPGGEIKISENALEALKKHDVLKDDILLFALSDMNEKEEYGARAVIMTKDGIHALNYKESEKSFKRKKNKKEAVTEKKEITENYVFYPSDSIKNIFVKENISSARLIMTTQNDERMLITYLSMFPKNEFYLFASNFEKIRKGEEPSHKEEDEDIFCPRCGRRYPDRNRKFCPECMDKFGVIKRMAGFMLKYKWRMVVIIAMLVVLSGLAVITPYVSSGFFYDSVLTKGGRFYGKVLLVILLIFVLRLFRMLVNMANGIITSALSAKMVRDMKKTIFEAIERLSLGYFTQRSTGALMNQVYNDATTIYWFFTDGFPYFAINVVQLTAVLVIMLTINPILTLFAIGLFPVVFILIGRLFKKDRKLHEKRYSRSKALSALLSDLLTGIRIVKTFSREKTETKRFGKTSRNLAAAEKKRSQFGSTAYPLVNILMFLGSVIVWGVGGWMIITSSFGMTYGKLLTFVAYLGIVYDPMYFFVDMVSWASDSMNSMNRLFEVMDANVEVKESENPVHKEVFDGDVSFENVRFSYTKNKKVINDVSFSVPAGGSLGIVGKTGSGKSTLANLLIRLYDSEDGRIAIDGVNVRDYAFADLRRNIAIVSQETYMFAGTIFDNIRFANPEATRDEVIAAAKSAGAHDFIMKRPDGYMTMVGFGYKDLSGGEKQRISIARALLRNPRILILDEATAAMDTQTERKIQAALEKLSVGRTTIMIAHRLSTLRNVDNLIVIKDGKVIENGTHASLVAQKGEYYKLYKLQLDALKNVGVEE